MGSGWRRGILAVVVVVAALGACVSQSCGATERRLLVYLSDAPDLAIACQSYLDRLQRATRTGAWVVLAQLGGVRVRLAQGRRLVVPSGERREGSVRALGEFVRWGHVHAGDAPMVLVLVGHGSPVAPIAGPFGQDGAEPGMALGAGNEAVDADALAAAVRDGLGDTSVRLDALFLDCCYGVSAETAAALERVTKVVVGSPGLLYSPGLPWDSILSMGAGAGDGIGGGLARCAIECLGRQQTSPPSTLVAVRTDRVVALLGALDRLGEALRSESREYREAVTQARGLAGGWGGNGELCDLVGFSLALAEVAPAGPVRRRASELAEAGRAAIISETVGTYQETRRMRSALAFFFPRALQRMPESYVAVGARRGYGVWAGYLSSYLSDLRQLVPGFE